MQLRRLAFLALALAFAPLAQAADLPPRTPPMPAFQVVETVPNWTGMYVGLTAGGAFGDRSHARVAYEDGTPFPGSVTGRSKTGVSIGGTLGYNQQIGSFVVGVEGDYSYLNLTNGSRLSYTDTFGNAAYQANGSVRSQISSYGTVRGRVGYLVTPDLLVYGTGGVAFADVSTRASMSEGFTFGNPPTYAGLAAYNGRNTGMKVGYAYGGGAEYKIDPSWSVKVEALRVQLPESRVFAGNDTGFGYAVRRVKNDFTVVRAGLNYSFQSF